jgi:hypothetical protein
LLSESWIVSWSKSAPHHGWHKARSVTSRIRKVILRRHSVYPKILHLFEKYLGAHLRNVTVQAPEKDNRLPNSQL